MKEIKKSDILFMSQFFYPEYVTAAALAFDTAKALQAAGFRVEALCGYPSEYYDKGKVPVKETVDGILIRRVRYLGLSRQSKAGRLLNYVSFCLSMAVRFPCLRRYRAILTYSSPPVLPLLAAAAAGLFGVKMVFVSHDVYPEIAIRSGVAKENGILARFMNFVNRCVFRRASRVVALSSEMKQFLATARPIGESRITVIPNWHRDLAPARAKERKADAAFCVSYLGNMGTCQDMETILSTMEMLKDDPKIRFLFAGHGNKQEAVQAAAGRCGNAEVFGFLQGEEYAEKLRQSDCFLVCLEKNMVGLGVPSKTYSYMMMGKPILAIMEPCDITRDIEQYGCGRVIANGDAEGLAEAIRCLAADPAACREMGKESRRAYEEKYTPGITLAKYEAMMREILVSG